MIFSEHDLNSKFWGKFMLPEHSVYSKSAFQNKDEPWIYLYRRNCGVEHGRYRKSKVETRQGSPVGNRISLRPFAKFTSLQLYSALTLNQ